MKPKFRLLENQHKPDSQSDDLVFTSPRGLAIDDHNYSQRIWKAVLAMAGIDKHHPPYAARHTFVTWGKRNGMTDDELAYWLGYSTVRMVRELYEHLNDKPVVPEFTLPTDD